MTRQARKVLKKLIQCQPQNGGCIFLYKNKDGSCSFVNNDTKKEFPFPYDYGETTEILQYLESEGMIECNAPGVIQVLHAGRHRHQIAFENAWHEFVRSFAMPFLVALATALVFSFLAAHFSWFNV